MSLRLVANRGHDRFGLGPLGAAIVNNPGIAAMVEHHAMLYADLADPVALLRGERADTELGRYWSYAGGGDPSAATAAQVEPYTALMAASQAMIADEVVATYPLNRHRCLLDLGGGDGSFLAAVAPRASDLRLMLLDLPAVAERASTRFHAAGLAARATATGGDFFTGPLPDGADIVSLVRVLHDHDDDAALAILQAARRALPDDGTLLIAEPMAGTAGAEPVGDAYFGFYLLAMGSGRPRTPAELEALLTRTGFGAVRLLRTGQPLLVRVLIARATKADTQNCKSGLTASAVKVA